MTSIIKNQLGIVLGICFILFACEKKELPAPAYNRGDIITAQIEMTSNYKNQVWFRLFDNKVVSTNLKTDWDLNFENTANGQHLSLNSAKAMRAYKTSYANLTQVTDTTGIATHCKADNPSGNLDSTAIGNWQTNNTVYIINRGYNEIGQQQGYYKLKIISVTTTHYVIEYAPITSTEIKQQTITKNNDYNNTSFSFTSNNVVLVEPQKNNYDLCFTQYTHVFTNPFQYYQVVGVLNNNYKTRIAKITNIAFANITIADTLTHQFYTTQNAIGYDWKSFSLNTNLFTIDATKCYIINDSRGFYYKLHFIDFYNEAGIKGYPKCEYKKL